MSWSSILIFALFLMLWLGPLLAIRRARGKGWPATKFAAGIYVAAALGLAMWWRIPVSAQYEVESAASAAIGSSQPPFTCPEVEAGAASLGRVSQGQIEATADGHLRISADLWLRLPERRRAAFIALASRIRRCLGGDGAQEVAIYDIRTNRMLDRAALADAGR